MRKFRIFVGYLILIFIALSMLYPFLVMVNLSFVKNDAIFSQAGNVFYTGLTVENYKHVFEQIPLSRYFLNSLIVATVTTVGQVLFASLAGYAFARFKFRGRDFLFLLIF